MTRDRLLADPDGPRILNINCWNEWTEGSYLEPDTKNGMSYLEAVKSETDEVEQCKMLSKIFGDDFPIPEKKNAAKKQMNFIPSTSASGVD